MKGLIVSLIIFVLYVLSTIVLSHLLKPRRHGKVLLYPIFAWLPVYFILFYGTPADFYILSPAWMAKTRWLDAAFGAIVYLLNCHSFFDFFFGFNGGFSMSLLLEVLRSGSSGVDSETIIRGYYNADGTDKIYSWRVPGLVEKGYLQIQPGTGQCQLTTKGRNLARITLLLKRLLNLGAGG